jgi:hypothetical protein
VPTLACFLDNTITALVPLVAIALLAFTIAQTNRLSRAVELEDCSWLRLLPSLLAHSLLLFSDGSAFKLSGAQSGRSFSRLALQQSPTMGRREFINIVKANEECFQEVKDHFAAKIGLTSVLHTPQYNTNSSTCPTGMLIVPAKEQYFFHKYWDFFSLTSMLIVCSRSKSFLDVNHNTTCSKSKRT